MCKYMDECVVLDCRSRLDTRSQSLTHGEHSAKWRTPDSPMELAFGNANQIPHAIWNCFPSGIGIFSCCCFCFIVFIFVLYHHHVFPNDDDDCLTWLSYSFHSYVCHFPLPKTKASERCQSNWIDTKDSFIRREWKRMSRRIQKQNMCIEVFNLTPFAVDRPHNCVHIMRLFMCDLVAEQNASWLPLHEKMCICSNRLISATVLFVHLFFFSSIFLILYRFIVLFIRSDDDDLLERKEQRQKLHFDGWCRRRNAI